MTNPLPLKILRILTRMNIGGPAVHASILSTQLDPHRVTTHLVVGRPDATEGDLSGCVHGPHVRVTQLNTLGRALHPWKDVVSLARLLKMIWQDPPHILHTHMAKAGALGRLAGILYNRVGPGRRRSKVILVHTFHGHVLDGYFAPWLSRFFLMLERWLARHTDCLIAVNQAVRRELLKHGIGRSEQWRVIPIGLNLSALAQLPVPNGTSPVRFGIVGRLVPIKNPQLFLEGLRRMVRDQPGGSVAGIIVGDGPLRDALERVSERLGLSEIVRFAGWQRDLRMVYEGLDVVCLTSWNEGTPVSLIEAMAAGRAVVATDVGGVRELLADGEDSRVLIPQRGFHIAQRGILVLPGDGAGLAAALNRVGHDPALRCRLGQAARAYVVGVYHAERLLRDISVLYEELVWSGPARGAGRMGASGKDRP
ncbi:MAG: glycosyltransferase [Candidatus Omnitrophica bacterium]|nr:glycosyltransferase [Candidatus Omnitrophota bacterium]